MPFLGSDKPIIESLQPNPVSQEEALENQFHSMSDIPLDYSDFESAKEELKKYTEPQRNKSYQV